MKIELRKPSDRGGWLCMPRLENCPEGKPGWENIFIPKRVIRPGSTERTF